MIWRVLGGKAMQGPPVGSAGGTQENCALKNPSSAQAGGYALATGGILVAAGLVLHPLPDHGFYEKSSMLQGTPLWGPIHAAITIGFAVVFLAVLLILAGGGSILHPWPRAMGWAATGVGLLYFSGTALINAVVMHPIAAGGISPEEASTFDAFNRLLVGFGWVGDPLFLLGITTLAYLQLRTPLIAMPRWQTIVGLTAASIAWLRGPGSLGIWFLEPAVLANIPAFLWLARYGLRIATESDLARIEISKSSSLEEEAA